MKINLLFTSFLPNSHRDVCEFGLSGQRHAGNGSDLDGLQALQAVNVLNVRWKIARRSRTPKMTIFHMPLSVQVNTSTNNCLKKQSNMLTTFDNTILQRRRRHEEDNAR